MSGADPNSIGTEAEWRVRGACEMNLNPYAPGKEPDFRKDVCVVLGALDAARAEAAKLHDALQDLVNNEGCSCNGLPGGPCPRCRVSYEETRALLAKYEAAPNNTEEEDK